MDKIIYPSIHSMNKREKEMAEVALELKINYFNKELTKREIKLAESIPNWSWDLTPDEKLHMIEEIKNFVEEKKRLPSI